MRYLALFFLSGMLLGCTNACNNYENEYIQAGPFVVKKGQQMRAFFDEFEEPMHTYNIGKDTIKWTYYVNENGEIVRYCDLKKYEGSRLCNFNVEFYQTYVSKAYSDC